MKESFSLLVILSCVGKYTRCFGCTVCIRFLELFLLEQETQSHPEWEKCMNLIPNHTKTPSMQRAFGWSERLRV